MRIGVFIRIESFAVDIEPLLFFGRQLLDIVHCCGENFFVDCGQPPFQLLGVHAGVGPGNGYHGMPIVGKISVGVFRIDTRLRIRMSRAITMKV